ncbi:telomerase protein component 1 isoform X2 [Kryptolebias marmoratus]|uniref:telomerase protein component 1 isoform X2 n=1 Tax=Kryptolebias marmoratus TaxID=37003 RepID=UPI0007F88B9A|nr:telomerase protein component 1 isoform X2 [Kryptolebias marmoratus]
MRALTLRQTQPGEQQHQPPSCGRSLTSNFSPPSLENKFLSGTSTTKPRSSLVNAAAQPSSMSSLQPSTLSSTSSSLLSTSSSFLSTQNKLLAAEPPRLSFSWTSPVPGSSLLSTALPGASLHNRFAQPPSFLRPDPSGQQDGDEGDDEEISEEMPSSFEETSVQPDEDDFLSEEERDEEDAAPDSIMEFPLLETETSYREAEDAAAVRQEEFSELDRGDTKAEEELKDKKYFLLNAVCCSLVNKSKAPGQQGWDSEDSVWTSITNLAKDISDLDPQFLLKVAVYTRQELNIRITANFLLALAASLPPAKPHVRRYFCAAVQLPSDWLEVVRIYSSCFGRSLPACLKKAMADKFKDFSEYQLAKYNTRKHRCKHRRRTPKANKPTAAQLQQWANLLRSDAALLEKFLQTEGDRAVVDKKQSEFSIKKLIQKLHIKEPAELVMAILGRKYPSDAKEFNRSGIKGAWDRERAGQRMKLKEPQTWDRLLSMEGNKAATWEKLIDSKSLPFMAMLRNLRNMITRGISEAHHKKILSRLTNQKAVVQSRQFPFRFLAAYKVIMELHALASASQKAIPSGKEILVSILKKIPKSRRYRNLKWEATQKKRVKMSLGVPMMYRLYKTKKAQLLKANQRLYTIELLDRYRRALETAVQIACRYNVPPLPGKTVILLSCNMEGDESWSKKQDFCLPVEPKQEEEEEDKDEEEEAAGSRRKRRTLEDDHDPLTPTKLEAAALLALMISSSSEDHQLCLNYYSHYREVQLKSNVLLDNVKSLTKEVKEFIDKADDEDMDSFYHKVFTKKNKVTNFIVLADRWFDSDLANAIRNYNNEANSKALKVYIFFSDNRHEEETLDRDRVVLNGFSEQTLRFVAERGSSRLLDHVEHLDKMYNIPPDGAKEPQTSDKRVSVPPSPKLRWRGVRVFISSTFRDMHAERDVLVRSVFPELRRRAAAHRLHLQEVELRWGVTEEESERAAELCLSEVCRSQMLVGILGERYGQVPPRPVLPDLPQYSWLASAPAGLSITEMEIRQFQALYPDMAPQRMFCYFRDPNIVGSIPAAWRSDFAAESKEAEDKLRSLKKRLLDCKVKVTENYLCEWGGVVEGKPYLKNLEEFGKAVLEDLWTAVQNQFVEEDEEAEAASEQEVHQGVLQRQFFGRAKLLSSAVEVVEKVQTKGGVVVVEGGAGEGKTVFMAALADSLRTGEKSRRNRRCDVISYSTAASQSACSVENLLRYLAQQLRKLKDAEEEESPLPHLYKDLLAELHSTLRETKKPLVVLVDGVDLLQDGGGRLSSDWIPQLLPQGVCLMLSMGTGAALLKPLTVKRGAVLFSLAPLAIPDRKEIVRKELDVFGKKLSDSAFNNQLQTLITKKGAASPLYLHLACEDLRSFASFDKLKENLQGLPQSLSQLVQFSLERLCCQYRGMLGIRPALAALTVSPTGLKERDLYSVVNTCNDLSSRDGQLAWEEVLQLSRKTKGRIPMAVFTRMLQSLQSLIGSSHGADDLLALNHPEVKRAFEDFLLPTESDRRRAHLVLAGHLWAMADPQGKDTFLHCEANSIMHLPSSLVGCGQLKALRSLLANFYFLHANVSHGLLHHLLETFSFHDKEQTSPSFELQSRLEDCRDFLQRHASTLSAWPALFVQQALNEPPETSAHVWAEGLVGRGGVRVVRRLNGDNTATQELCELLSSFASEPTCVALSSDKRLTVVGTGRGTLHVFHAQTGQEVKALVSSCDGISSCVFLDGGQLASTSFDGQIETWDVENGCRTALIDGHANAITASDLSPDRKHLATVSLDFTLKVWSPAKGHEVASLPSTSPLNCVTFDPEGHLLTAGCWNGDVLVWNWLQNQTLTALSGHRRSVRCLSFSPSSSMLCSGSVSGEVRVWSVRTSTCVGCFQAHGGATEALAFLQGGAMLLSAGADHTLQLWSGGLGRSVATLKSDNFDLEPPQKKLRSDATDAPALCVAVDEDYAAVGYHGDGIKLFSLDSGERVWVSADLAVSIPCLLWLSAGAERTETRLLVSGGSDKRLRLWRRDGGEEGAAGGLTSLGAFGMQTDAILALAQSSTHLAAASDDFSMVLWLLKDLTSNPSAAAPQVLRGHRGGVTCLAFSPDGAQVLSGAKDQALMVWDVGASPAALSKSLLHAHRDWITGCVWTPDCVISSSNDGRLCFWDLEAALCLREISWRNPLTSVCCLDQHVIAGCSEGALHVWDWKTSAEICHISAHRQRIHHCSVLPHPDKITEPKPGELSVFTASDDGTVRLWKPLQVEHFSTFQGHSGSVHGVALKTGSPEFLTVSEDCSLRRWTWTAENPTDLKGPISSLCLSETEDLLLAGYESGLLELWQQNAVICRKQASDGPVMAACSMPDGQFAVSYVKQKDVDVWKLLWSQQHGKSSLVKVATYEVNVPMVRLVYCSTLIGITVFGTMYVVTAQSEQNYWNQMSSIWTGNTRLCGVIRNDEKSLWLMGGDKGQVHVGFVFWMGPETTLQSSFTSVKMKCDEDKLGTMITASTIDREFVVCGDVDGNMWFNQQPDVCSWSEKRPAHGGRITGLRLTRSTIVSASYDRTVKLWDRNTKKQVGMFVCGGPVLFLEMDPRRPGELVCADGQGKLYFLSWNEPPS